MVSMSSQAVRCEKVAISRRQRTTEVIFIHYKKEVTYGLSNSIYIRQATSNTAISDDLKWPSRLLCYAEAQCRQIDKIDKLISIAPINSSESLSASIEQIYSRLVSSYDKLADYFPAFWRINHVRLTRLSDDKHQKQHGHAQICGHRTDAVFTFCRAHRKLRTVQSQMAVFDPLARLGSCQSGCVVLWTLRAEFLIGWSLDTIDTIRDAILTCARKPTWVSLSYRTETTTKKCKNRKTKD